MQIDIPASANQWPAALASEPRKVSDQLHLGANLVCVMNLKEVTFSKGMSREILPETLSPDYKLAQIRPGCGASSWEAGCHPRHHIYVSGHLEQFSA